MTTSYAKAVYLRARRDVAEMGFIGAVATAALEHIGHSTGSIAGLEADYREYENYREITKKEICAMAEQIGVRCPL